MIIYPAMLDVPRELATFVSSLLAANRGARGTRRGTRALSCFKQALFVLVWFREQREVALAGKGFGISQATAYRYLDEAIAVLCARVPELTEALRRVADDGSSHVIVDGKIVAADRCRTKKLSKKGTLIDAWYAGKTHDFGGNVEAVMRPDGFPVWVCDVEPGSVPDITCARDHALGALYAAASQLDLPTLADPGYEGAGIGVHTPVKQPADGRDLDIDTRTYNLLLCSLRCLGERGFAILVGRWRTLQHITASPSKIGKIAQAALVLTHFEHGYLRP